MERSAVIAALQSRSLSLEKNIEKLQAVVADGIENKMSNANLTAQLSQLEEEHRESMLCAEKRSEDGRAISSMLLEMEKQKTEISLCLTIAREQIRELQLASLEKQENDNRHHSENEERVDLPAGNVGNGTVSRCEKCSLDQAKLQHLVGSLDKKCATIETMTEQKKNGDSKRKIAEEDNDLLFELLERRIRALVRRVERQEQQEMRSGSTVSLSFCLFLLIVAAAWYWQHSLPFPAE
jgi:hypothetical protein